MLGYALIHVVCYARVVTAVAAFYDVNVIGSHAAQVTTATPFGKRGVLRQAQEPFDYAQRLTALGVGSKSHPALADTSAILARRYSG